jgi:Kef-type K+ transport system membrane component KefB
MTINTRDVAHLLLALAVMLVAAHGMGTLFAKLRQPRVIGEILGGLLLGPTVLGAVAPGVQRWLFPTEGPVPAVLGAIYQLGLLLLMYCSGMEVRSSIKGREGRAAASILLFGTVAPFVAGLAAVRLIDEPQFFGPNGNKTSFLLVFAIAMAVTSIPVISRIMFDLGILDTSFARIVLSVAVVEDIVLYIVLAVALGISGHAEGALFGLPGTIGLHPGSAADLIYHVIATFAILTLLFVFGRSIYRAVSTFLLNPIGRWSPVAFQLVFMLAACLACVFLGIQPFFGAFVAGIVVGSVANTPDPVHDAACVAIREFSMAFFIPIYFAVVGLQLDLLHGFVPLFFISYLLLACVIKTVSVYTGARVGGQAPYAAVNLAVAMNARGGPGIVLASVVFGAGIVNQSFYAVLVLLAVVTSMVAGSWLQRVPRSKLIEAGAGGDRQSLDQSAQH